MLIGIVESATKVNVKERSDHKILSSWFLKTLAPESSCGSGSTNVLHDLHQTLELRLDRLEMVNVEVNPRCSQDVDRDNEGQAIRLRTKKT